MTARYAEIRRSPRTAAIGRREGVSPCLTHLPVDQLSSVPTLPILALATLAHAGDGYRCFGSAMETKIGATSRCALARLHSPKLDLDSTDVKADKGRRRELTMTRRSRRLTARVRSTAPNWG